MERVAPPSRGLAWNGRGSGRRGARSRTQIRNLSSSGPLRGRSLDLGAALISLSRLVVSPDGKPALEPVAAGSRAAKVGGVIADPRERPRSARGSAPRGRWLSILGPAALSYGIPASRGAPLW